MTFQRRRLIDGGHVLVATPLERMGVVAAFSERTGGRSRSPFDSLNVSFSVGDDPADVRANRRTIATGLGIGPFACAGLVHGSSIALVGPDRAGAGYDDPNGVVAGADGLATRTSGLPLAITSADCLPLVLASSSEPTVVVVHAGWRGLASGILARAVAAFERALDIAVAVGPAIGPDHYEVGADVVDAVARAPFSRLVARRVGDRFALDLVETARATLARAGVGDVSDTGLCTACERARFFSHRADGGRTGRQVAIAVRAAGTG
jgi:YfiH family protein